jgi:tetratricopeptide (TPR) repeat protein
METRKTIKHARGTVIIFALVLTGVFLALQALDRGSDYAAEKELWKLSRELEKLALDPEHAPQGGFDALNEKFERFRVKFARFKGRPSAMLLQARVFLLQRNFDSARGVIEEMVAEYRLDPDIAVKGLAEIGRVYVLQDDLEKIVATYHRIMEDYPLSDLGMKAPLLLVQLYSERQDGPAAQAALLHAENHYHQLMRTEEEPVPFRARQLLARTYAAREQWELSLRAYKEILLNYAESPYLTPRVAEAVIRAINTIGVAKLKDWDRPVEVYTEFMARYPDHPLNGTFRGIVNSLNQIRKTGESGESSG